MVFSILLNLALGVYLIGVLYYGINARRVFIKAMSGTDPKETQKLNMVAISGFIFGVLIWPLTIVTPQAFFLGVIRRCLKQLGRR